MAASKKKQDEKHLKLLREIVTLAHNKTCFDCHQRGPTYVNMTIGSFVCTSCSGILRGLNPPHRVKSISMTSFTPEEMEFLKSRGNDFCRQVWLGLYDARSRIEPDSKDENKIRDFMTQKYEKKRWYVAPTDSMHEEARKQNTPASKPEQTRRIGGMINSTSLGKITAHPVASDRTAPSSALPNSIPLQKLALQSQNTQNPAAPQALPGLVSAPNQSKPKGGLDLLGELGGDPFAAQSAAQNNNNSAGGGFADFANFNTMTAPTGVPSQQAAFPPTSSVPLQPVGNNQAAASTADTSTSATFAAFPANSSMSNQDKYAALADLDNVFGGGSGVAWDGTMTGGPPPMPQSSSSGNIWGATAPPTSTTSIAPGLPNSNSMPAPGISSGANPFGVAPTAVAPSVAVGNPFMASKPAGFGQPATANVPFGMPPAGAAGFPVAVAPAGPYGVPVPNGVYANQQNGGFWTAFDQGGGPPRGAPPAYPGTAGGIAPQQAFATAGQSAFGSAPQQQPQQFGGWPSQPAGNPFMSGNQQQAIPPRSSSTNPFL